MRCPLDPTPDVKLDGWRVRSTTRFAPVSAYQLVLTTVLPDRGIELHSSYIGHAGLSESRVTHLLLAPSVRAFDTREHPQSQLPVTAARRRCLYDHLQRLLDLLRELGYDASIELDDETLLAVEA